MTGKDLPGVKFKITAANGELVPDNEGLTSSNGLYTTDENGQIYLKKLNPNTYVVTEVETIDGYLLNAAPQTVVVSEADTQVLTFTNMPLGGLLVKKMDSATKEPLADVIFKITRTDGTVAGNSNGEFRTDERGFISLPDLEPGSYIVREVQAKPGYLLDDTPHAVEIKDHQTYTLEVFNQPLGNLIINKLSSLDNSPLEGMKFQIKYANGQVVDNKNGQVSSNGIYYTDRNGQIILSGIYGVTFLLYDSTNKPIGQYTSDDQGYVYIEDITVAGRYYLKELENQGYLVDTQMKTVYLKPGETTLIEWENTAITGQIQITKTSEDYNSMNGWPAGTPIPNTVFEIYDRANNLVDTIRTDKNGLASSRPLPLGRYKVMESQSADFYGLDKTPMEAEIEFSGQIVRLAMTNKALYTNVSINKRGYAQVMPGQSIRYDFSNIANNSTTALSSFYWRDTLPASLRLDKIVTGTYNVQGNYKIVYKTNLSGETYRVIADNLNTMKNSVVAASPAALGLASNEYVTEVMFVFGVVPSNFRQVEAPQIHCNVVSWLKNGAQFVNQADVGGIHNEQWIMATDRWVTTVYTPTKPSTPLPRTGY